MGLMTRIHILGAGQWQVPGILVARQLGYRTYVTDMYEVRPGYSVADHHEQIDITNLEATLRHARKHAVNGIVCDTTDVGVPVAARIAEELGLWGIGYEVALNFTSKLRMRRAIEGSGLDNPRFMAVTSVDDAVLFGERAGYPFILKPSSNQSSRGVVTIESREEIASAYSACVSFRRNDPLVAEELLKGTEMTVESMVVDGAATALAVSEKEHYPHHPHVAKRLFYHWEFSDRRVSDLLNYNQAVIEALGLRNGITHAEYIFGERPYLVEIAARGGGSYVHSRVVPIASGFDLPREYLKCVVRDGTWAAPETLAKKAVVLDFFDATPGILTEVEGLEVASSMPGVEDVLIEVHPGDTIQPAKDDRSRIGLVIVSGDTKAEVEQRLSAFKGRVRFHVTEENVDKNGQKAAPDKLAVVR